MKELLKIGNVVDDGDGDYLRKGGEKINDNFNELYYQLGDGEVPHAAGAWKTHTASQGVLKPAMGEAWTVNTTSGAVSVQLPKGTPSDYNHVIRIRDVWGTWQRNAVTLVPASGDTLKGSAGSKKFPNNFQDLDLVYCSPGRWEFIENKYVNKISSSDLTTVAKRDYIATQGQTDFPDVFSGNLYNIGNTEVYLRGNLLSCFYSATGVWDAANSDYGSIGPNNTIIAPDGKSIKIKYPLTAGDTVTIKTYFDGVGTWRSSYNRESLQMLDASTTNLTTIPGQTWVGDLSTKTRILPEDLGLAPGTRINPFAVEVLLNGRQLVESGDAGIPDFGCSTAWGPTEEECLANGGLWVQLNADYSIETTSGTDTVVALVFPKPFEDKDLLIIRWYNNNIGTTMDIDEITSVTDTMYLNVQEPLNLLNRIEYTDYQNPSQKTKRAVDDEYGINVTTMKGMFDLLYPIGTKYENFHNPANPADYMGMGVWKLYSEGRTTVGWSSNPNDPYYALNNNDLDSNGLPSHTAGGTVGVNTHSISRNEVPVLESTDKVLINDDNGTVIVGGCQFDPDAEGPGYTKYREGTLKVNADITTVQPFEIIQPSITAYVWIRVG